MGGDSSPCAACRLFYTPKNAIYKHSNLIKIVRKFLRKNWQWAPFLLQLLVQSDFWEWRKGGKYEALLVSYCLFHLVGFVIEYWFKYRVLMGCVSEGKFFSKAFLESRLLGHWLFSYRQGRLVSQDCWCRRLPKIGLQRLFTTGTVEAAQLGMLISLFFFPQASLAQKMLFAFCGAMMATLLFYRGCPPSFLSGEMDAPFGRDYLWGDVRCGWWNDSLSL